MKKIVALVLCLALALSLATVAMAAKTAKYDVWAIEDKEATSGAAVEKAVEFVAADEDEKNIAHYAGESNNYYKVAEADADFFLVAAGTKAENVRKADKIFVKVGEVEYDFNAKVVKVTLGDKCGQITKGDYTKKSVFYTYVDENDDVMYAVKEDSGSLSLLVDGKIVKAKDLGEYDDTFNGHTWVVNTKNDKDEVLTVKCADKCGTVATLYNGELNVPDGLKAEWTEAFGWIGYKDGKAAGSDDNVTSAETFDAGIAVYAGMALASVAGSAVVIGKKKEF